MFRNVMEKRLELGDENDQGLCKPETIVRPFAFNDANIVSFRPLDDGTELTLVKDGVVSRYTIEAEYDKFVKFMNSKSYYSYDEFISNVGGMI